MLGSLRTCPRDRSRMTRSARYKWWSRRALGCRSLPCKSIAFCRRWVSGVPDKECSAHRSGLWNSDCTPRMHRRHPQHSVRSQAHSFRTINHCDQTSPLGSLRTKLCQLPVGSQVHKGCRLHLSPMYPPDKAHTQCDWRRVAVRCCRCHSCCHRGCRFPGDSTAHMLPFLVTDSCQAHRPCTRAGLLGGSCLAHTRHR